MYKKGITLFFLLSFTIFIIAPTAMLIVDNSYDVSYFYNLNEEENKNNETLKKYEFELFDLNKYILVGFSPDKVDQSKFYLKEYTSLHLECFSPPPEQNGIS